jgi:hypothetical protein
MNSDHRHGKCLHCRKLFRADYRNRSRQQYCAAPECQKASKQASQKRWLSKPENRDYFRGVDQVRRVQEWRRAHPGYGKGRRRQPRRALQDSCSAQLLLSQSIINPELRTSRPPPPPALQDICQVQTPLLVGLIAQFTDATLQEDIARYTRRLIAKGQDILDQPSRRSAKGNYVAQTNPATGPPAASAGAFQLARSPVGAGKLPASL